MSGSRSLTPAMVARVRDQSDGGRAMPDAPRDAVYPRTATNSATIRNSSACSGPRAIGS